MNKINKAIDNEEGYVLVLSLFIMMILTVIGVSATNTSTTEILISRSARNYQSNFYRAEAAAMEAAARVRNAAIDPAAFVWLNNSSDLPVSTNLRDDANWKDATEEPNINNRNSEQAVLDQFSRYLVLNNGVVPGDQMTMGSPSRTDLRIYGRYECDSGEACGPLGGPGEVLLEIGYLK